MPPHDSSINALWVAFALLFAIIVGVSAGFLGWRGGQHPTIAILTGGAAFSGAVMLQLLIKNQLGLSRGFGNPGRQFSAAARDSVMMSSTGEADSGSWARAILRQPQDWLAR